MNRLEQLERKLGEMRRVADLFKTLAMEIGDRGFLGIHKEMETYIQQQESTLNLLKKEQSE